LPLSRASIRKDVSDSAKVVVLGSRRREEIFGARPAVGQTLSIAGRTYTVVGVMEKKEFYFNEADGNALDWMNKFVFVPTTTLLNRMSGDRAGQKIAYMHSVSDVETVGMWDGKQTRLTLPASLLQKPDLEGCAVLLQSSTADGTPAAILGAAVVMAGKNI